jgi:hypothetical protein
MAKNQPNEIRKCSNPDCGKKVPAKDTRGARNGDWPCVPCWEEEYARPAPDETAGRTAKL